jgi:hypothetical protein
MRIALALAGVGADFLSLDHATSIEHQIAGMTLTLTELQHFSSWRHA